MMLGRDGIAGLACLAVSIWLLVLTRGLPPAIMVPIGPSFYPRVVLGAMALLSVILVARDLMTAPAIVAPAAAGPNYALVLATFVIFGLYVGLLPELGFRIATFLFVAGLQATLEWPRSWRRWALLLIVAAATTAACYLAFEEYLSVLLPRGAWSGI